MLSRLVFKVTVCLLLVSMAAAVQAVGVVPLGKERCKSSSLEAEGILPDTLNRFKETLVFLKLGSVVDRIAGEIKAVLSQFGVQTTHHWGTGKDNSKAQSVRRLKRKSRIRAPGK